MRGSWSSILVVGVLVVGVGCGDDDDPITPISTAPGTTTEATAASAEEFVAAGDGICAEANAAIANLSTGTSTSSVAASQQLEITQDLLDGLRGLGAPDDQDGALERYYTALEGQIDVLGEQEAAATSGDPATADALAGDLDAVEAEAQAAAAEFGFTECGEEGTALPSTGDPTAPVTPVDPGAAPVEPAPVPVEPVTPVEPVPEPVPVEPAPPTGGTGTEPGGSTGGAGGGGSAGGSSGGVSPG